MERIGLEKFQSMELKNVHVVYGGAKEYTATNIEWSGENCDVMDDCTWKCDEGCETPGISKTSSLM
ncbi:MAG: hypothetical protein AAFY71_27340 [Bacteroidota bacterium]